MNEPREMSPHSLLWAMRQVMSTKEEPITQEESDAEFAAKRAQAEADALAAGCPPENVMIVGVLMSAYQGLLNQMVELLTLEYVEDANVARTRPSMVPVLETLIESVYSAGEALGRTEEMVDVDVADAEEQARVHFEEIMVLACTHHDLSQCCDTTEDEVG